MPTMPGETMSARTTNALLIFCLFFLVLPVPATQAHEPPQGPEPLGLTILTCDNPTEMYKNFGSLKLYLEQKVARKFDFSIQEDPETLADKISAAKADFLLMPSASFVQFLEAFQKDFLLTAIPPNGQPSYSAIVIVPEQSGIVSLQQLRGKAVVFGQRQDAAKWHAAQILFQREGIDIHRDLRLIGHSYSCEEAAFFLVLKKYDAGLICNYSLDRKSVV